MRYNIGLDIGITSVGWATMLLNEEDEPCRILDMGSRVFEAAENPKDGASLAAPRRENRSMRRRLRRRRHRKERIKLLLEKNNVISREELSALYASPKFECDVYELRYLALKRKLDRDELVRVLIHLSQRRGFRSNRKVDAVEANSESGKLTAAVNANSEIMKQKGYSTIGEMLWLDPKFAEYKRNKSENYSNTFLRSLFCSEIATIFEQQRLLGNTLATKELEEAYLEIYTSQRSFEDGPGKGSTYFGNQVEKMLGRCTFETDEPRAMTAQFSFEYSSLLQKINAVRILSQSVKRQLSSGERKALLDMAFAKAEINYSMIRKTLKLGEADVFNITYGDKLPDEVEKKTKFSYLRAYHKIKKAYGELHKHLSPEQLNYIGYALSVYKNDSKISEYLLAHGFSPVEVELALTVPTFSKSGNLSVKACDKLIPFLEQGMVYSDACTAAGYNFKADDKDKRQRLLPANPQLVPELRDITNPVVRRAIAQTIKVINSIIRSYDCSPCFISVELARELSRNFTDRKQMEKSQKNNFENNQRLIDSIKRLYGIQRPTGMDLIKLKLWEEQDGICPYSMHPISRERLFEEGYTDIDHIIPYSLSFDDSYFNKVLVFAAENRQKGNRLPLQYVSDKDKFMVWVNNSVRERERRRRLLKEEFTEQDSEEWKSRSLNDTKYISTFMYNYINTYLEFAPNVTNRKKTVMAVNGRATAYVRKRWGIVKIREDGDLHHAVDAAVIACITDGMIRRIATYSKQHELRTATADMYDGVNQQTGEKINRFPMPYPCFRKELEMRLCNNPQDIMEKLNLPNYRNEDRVEPLFVSRMPRHKVTGSAHKDTIRSAAAIDEGYKVSKVALTTLKLGKDGEIEEYYMPESDCLLYDALRKQLVLHNGDAKQAFVQPFYKPKSDGTQGPLVKKVKLLQKTTLNVDVHGGTAIADNGDMVRIDVFMVEGDGYYLVPIYVSDTLTGRLPNRAVVAHKPYQNWKEMEDKNFIFSLYPSDLVKITFKKPATLSIIRKESTLPASLTCAEIFAYYVSADISSGALTIINHDKTYQISSMGLKTIPLLEKYQVDILGNKYKVGRETRQYFE